MSADVHRLVPGLPTILTHLSESKKTIEAVENEDEHQEAETIASEASKNSPCAEPEWLSSS